MRLLLKAGCGKKKEISERNFWFIIRQKFESILFIFFQKIF